MDTRTSLENDIWKSGFASPTLPATGLPLASNPTNPKIWVGELSCSIWKVPSEVPKPPVWNVGTVSFVILALLA